MRLIIRKIQFAPLKMEPGPKAETTRQFMMSDKPLHLEASLEKEVSTEAVPSCVTMLCSQDTWSCNPASSHCRSSTTETPST